MPGLLDYNTYLNRLDNSRIDGKGDDNARGYEGGEVGENTGGWSGVAAKSMQAAAGVGGLPGAAINAAASVADGRSLKDAALGFGVTGLAQSVGGLPGAAIGLGYGIATSKDKAKAATQATAATVGGIFAGPFGAIAGGMLGAAAYGSYKDGAIGDGLDSRTDEAARDNLEDGGYSYGQSRDATSGEPDAPGTGGTPTEGAYSEMARASGDSGRGIDSSAGLAGFGGAERGSEADALGRASGLGLDAAAGYDDGGYGGGNGNGGGSDGGGTGRGSSDNDSSPGGIGGV